MLHHENQQREQRIITAVVGSNRKVGITPVKLKLNPNAKKWAPTSSKVEMEEVCTRENEAKFRQTKIHRTYETTLQHSPRIYLR